MPVKNMRHERAMRPEPLPGHRTAQAFLLLCHVSHMIPIRIHNHIFICLFKSTVHGDRLSAQTPFVALLVSTHIIAFINSSCLCTTKPEFANSLVAG